MTTTNIVTRTNANPAVKSKTSPDEDIAIHAETTTVDKDKSGQFTSSVVPYVRESQIQVTTSRMRPNKQVYLFFGDQDVSGLFQNPNIIEIDGNQKANITDMISGYSNTIIIGNSVAKVLVTELDLRDSANANSVFTKIYVTDFAESDEIKKGDTISVEGKESWRAAVNSYSHYSGVVGAGSNSHQIVLANDANSSIDDYYVGNTIAVVGGINAGKRANITAYNAATRTATVSPNSSFEHDFFLSKPGSVVISRYTLGDHRVSYNTSSEVSHFTTDTGYIAGVLHLPDPEDESNTGITLTSGETLIRVIDNPTNDTTSYTTRADYVYTVNSPSVTKTNVVVDADKKSTTVVGDDAVATTPGTPKIDKQVPKADQTTPTQPLSVTNECKVPVSKCSLQLDGGCFHPQASSGDVATFQGGYLDVHCIPRWRFTDANGIVIKGFPNRQFSDSSIEFDAVKLGLPGATNYAAVTPNWTAGYHPSTRNRLTDSAALLDVVPFPAGTYLQYWSPDFNGWSESTKVEGLYPSDVFCNDNLCTPKSSAPIGQSFYVSAQDHRNGLFISSIVLYFKSVGTLPIEVQIRTVENGIPSNKIIPGAVATIDALTANITQAPDITNTSSGTVFTFPSPVYLSPGSEYCFVVQTDDWGYELFIGETGKKNISNKLAISKKQYTGSLFKSNNGFDWYPVSAEDITFVMNKCNFAPSTGTLYLEEDKISQGRISLDEYPFDSFQLQSDAVEIGSTKLDFYYKATSNSSSMIDGNYKSFDADKTVAMTEKKKLSDSSSDQSFLMKIDFTTTNPDVSPVFYQNRQNLVLLNNNIRPSGIFTENTIVINPGSGYDASNTFVRIDSSVYSVNANAYPVISAGKVTGIVVDNPGKGYFEGATMSIIGGNNNAIGFINTETDQQGGTSAARYISETVTLLDGFDAGDLRVFVDGIKPMVSDIQVYYKVRNLTDKEPIQNRKWVRMVQATNPYLYSVTGEKHEYEFRPSMTSNNIIYSSSSGTFKTFNQYAIKIAMFSDGTLESQVPKATGVRAIALPPDSR